MVGPQVGLPWRHTSDTPGEAARGWCVRERVTVETRVTLTWSQLAVGVSARGSPWRHEWHPAEAARGWCVCEWGHRGDTTCLAEVIVLIGEVKNFR